MLLEQPIQGGGREDLRGQGKTFRFDLMLKMKTMLSF